MSLPANQYNQLSEDDALATQQAAIVEPSEGSDALSPESPELPESKLIVESTEQPSTNLATEPATAQKPTKNSSAVESQADGESNQRESPSAEANEARVSASESSLLKPDAIVGTEENINAGAETLPAQSTPNSSAVANSAGEEAIAAALRTPTGPTGENSSAANIDAETDLVSTADRARFVQRVGRAFQAAQTRDGQIQLRLSPPELGSLRISITVQEGMMSAKVEAETAAARNILLDNLPALRDRLAEQEIRIEKFNVDVPRHGGQETGSSGANDREARQSQTDSTPTPRERDSGSSEATTSEQNIRPSNVVTESGLDVRI